MLLSEVLQHVHRHTSCRILGPVSTQHAPRRTSTPSRTLPGGYFFSPRKPPRLSPRPPGSLLGSTPTCDNKSALLFVIDHVRAFLLGAGRLVVLTFFLRKFTMVSVSICISAFR